MQRTIINMSSPVIGHRKSHQQVPGDQIQENKQKVTIKIDMSHPKKGIEGMGRKKEQKETRNKYQNSIENDRARKGESTKKEWQWRKFLSSLRTE